MEKKMNPPEMEDHVCFSQWREETADEDKVLTNLFKPSSEPIPVTHFLQQSSCSQILVASPNGAPYVHILGGVFLTEDTTLGNRAIDNHTVLCLTQCAFSEQLFTAEMTIYGAECFKRSEISV